MTSKPAFKTVFTIIITGLFGYLLYMLINSVKTGFFFTDSTGKDVIISGTAMMVGPLVLSIICSIIRKRYLWLLSIANLFLWIIIGAAMGEETTIAHAFVYGAMIVVPYILCLIMILGEKKEYKAKPYPVSSSGSSYGGYSPSSSFGSSTNGSLSFSEKEAYIIHNCHGAYSTTAKEKIENDPNLTASQKEELKHHLFIYGD